jgi:hypothetical protein
MLGVVALALASSGGGNKKKARLLKPEFAPIKTANGFSLRSGISYSGSQITSTQKSKNGLSLNSLITYQKGNTIYIMPNQHRIVTNKCMKSNLNLLDIKISLHK